MNLRHLLLLAGLAAASCAQQPPPPDSAVLPSFMPGTASVTDGWLLQEASYTLMDPARLRGRPADAARTIAAVDYFAGSLQWNAKWPRISNLTRTLMLEARPEARQAVGISLDARSQEVVDRLLAAANALAAQDTATARAVLASPIFTLGPDATLARLSNLPYLPKSNLAIQDAAQEAFPVWQIGPNS